MQGQQWITRLKIIVTFLILFASAETLCEDTKRYQLNIASQRVEQALRQLATATDSQLLFPYDLVETLESTSTPISGRYTLQGALTILLKGTPLSGELTKEGVILITLHEKKSDDKGGINMQSKKGLLGSTLAFLFSSSVVQAETTEEPGRQLEEVVVTAQKRGQSLQDVPISVSVVSGESFEKLGLSTIWDVAKLSPGFAYQQSQDPRTAVFTIRGIGSPGNIPGLEPSSVVVIDGENLARSAILSNDLADIERIEILKGPQSTLFGKGASAGAISISTRAPTINAEELGNIDLTIAEDQETIVRGGVNLNISDNSAIRVNGFYRDAAGYVENVNSNEPNGGEEEGFGLRVQYLFAPSDTLEVLLRAEYYEKDFGPLTQVIADFPDQSSAVGQGFNPQIYEILALSNQPLGPNNTRTSQRGNRRHADIENTAFSVKVAYQLSDNSQLVYNGSYRDWDLFSNEDQTLIAFDLTPSYYGGDTLQETTQHELRIESVGDNALGYVAGLTYYYNDNGRTESWQDCIDFTGLGIPANTVIDPVNLVVTDCGGNGTPLNVDLAYKTNIVTDYYAAFGQVDYQLTDNVVLIAGARVLREEQELNFVDATQDFTFDASDTAVIGKAGIQYHFNDDVMTYFTVSTGYKGRAWDNGLFRVEQDFIDGKWPLDPETTLQYEIGLRSSLWDNRVRLNGTLFHSTIDDFVDRTFFFDNATVGQPENRLLNAGDVRTQGAEIELNTYLTDHFTVDASFSYVNAEFITDAFVGCIAANLAAGVCSNIGGADVFNVKGRQLAHSPEISYNISATYRIDLAADYTASFRLSYRWLDEQFFNINGDPVEARDSFGITDFSVDIDSPANKYGMTLFIKNLTDKLYFERTHGTHITGYGPGVSAVVPRDYTRYAGISFRTTF